MKFERDETCINSGSRSAAEAPIDIERLLEQCMGSADVVALVLKEFENQLAGDLKTIEASIRQQHAAAVAATAHALKGAAGAVAAASLHSVAESLEKIAKSGNLDAAATQVANLTDEVARCVEFLPTVRRAIAKPAASKG